MTRKLISFAMICLAGCDSPPPSAEDPFAGSTVAPVASGSAASDVGGSAAGAGDAGAGGANPGGIAITDGVSVKGIVKVEGYKSGAIQMDFLKSGGASPPLTVIRITEPGPFEVVLPKDSGKVDVILYLDRTGDGPGQGDFRMNYDKNPLEIGVTAIEGLEIAMVDTGLSTDAPVNAAQDVVAAPPPTPAQAGGIAPTTTTAPTAVSAPAPGGTTAPSSPVVAPAPGGNNTTSAATVPTTAAAAPTTSQNQ